MTKTTLEEKWAEETKSKSAIEKAYKGKKKNEAASLSPEELDKSVIDQLPAPTGWRLMVLPFKTKKVTDEMSVALLASLSSCMNPLSVPRKVCLRINPAWLAPVRLHPLCDAISGLN